MHGGTERPNDRTEGDGMEAEVTDILGSNGTIKAMGAK